MASAVYHVANMWRLLAPSSMAEEGKNAEAESKESPFLTLKKLFWWTYTNTVEDLGAEKEKNSRNSLKSKPINPDPAIDYRWFFSTSWKQGPWIAHDDKLNEVIEDHFQKWMSDIHFIQYEGKRCVIDFENFQQCIATEDAYDRRQLIRVAYE